VASLDQGVAAVTGELAMSVTNGDLAPYHKMVVTEV
jgi:hypothetical protein